ncbi:hypothetical protein GUJ93_ZPchr0002g24534 [Zizania palustris]|uniref:Uncharacterized protein n=1 Tax=Zizania palustris TaxID=103762 RepID=A0A8J5RVA2_ZIZPA|nr:hypothetical protein GUJ93_ZPchr0002g24534 [Zizania palustris]
MGTGDSAPQEAGGGAQAWARAGGQRGTAAGGAARGVARRVGRRVPAGLRRKPELEDGATRRDNRRSDERGCAARQHKGARLRQHDVSARSERRET